MAEGITLVFCMLIAGVGVLCFFALLVCKRHFSGILKDVRESRIDDASVGQDIDSEGSLAEETVIRTRYNSAKLEKARSEFGKRYTKYVCWSQIVPLFSSFGLLGTVAGLILSSKGEMQVSKLMSSLSLAMWTTLAGLVCTIILKIVDSVGPGKVINDIDVELSLIDEKMNKELYKKAGGNAR